MPVIGLTVLAWNEVYAGSSPVAATINILLGSTSGLCHNTFNVVKNIILSGVRITYPVHINNAGVAQLVRALPCQGKG